MDQVLPALTHFSARPLRRIVSVQQEDVTSYYGKPRGLWVSIEDRGEGWSAWCKSERYGLDCFKYETAVVLRPNAPVLFLRSPDDLDAFTDRFGVPVIGPAMFRPPAIEWRQVAREYQAIVIAPYIWDRRLHDVCSWYYTWDCASGCIWDADAVATISCQPYHLLREEVLS